MELQRKSLKNPRYQEKGNNRVKNRQIERMGNYKALAAPWYDGLLCVSLYSCCAVTQLCGVSQAVDELWSRIASMSLPGKSKFLNMARLADIPPEFSINTIVIPVQSPVQSLFPVCLSDRSYALSSSLHESNRQLVPQFGKFAPHVCHNNDRTPRELHIEVGWTDTDVIGIRLLALNILLID